MHCILPEKAGSPHLALDRMESLSVTNERFEIPAKFS